MPALTQDRITEKKIPGYKAYPIAAATKIYDGAMVCKNATGYAVPAADVASYKILGVATVTIDNTTGANGDKQIQVDAPILARFNATSITQVMVGNIMYVVDDNTIDDTTGTNSIKAGILAEFISVTEGWVWIDPPAIHS